MDTNNPIILEVYDITWDQSKQESTDLPKELKLQWIKKIGIKVKSQTG